jgi:mannose/fructose/N-acetylgalactosamine-specific phosphotransferase system component IIB
MNRKIKNYFTNNRVKEELRLTTNFISEDDKKSKSLLGDLSITLPSLTAGVAGLIAFLCSDFDQDGLSNWEELFRYSTDFMKADTSGDGIPDGLAVSLGLNPLKVYPSSTKDAINRMDKNLLQEISKIEGGFEQSREDLIELLSSLPKNEALNFAKLVAADKELDKDEKEQVKFLLTLKKEDEATFKELIEKGSLYDFDLDKDGLNNYFEYIFSTKKDGLYNPFVKNNRYVVMIGGSRSLSGLLQNTVDTFLEQKVPRENIFVFCNDINSLEAYTKAQSTIMEIFDNVIKLSDENDIVFILNSTHGGTIYYGGVEEFNKNVFNKIKAKVIVYIDDECKGYTFIEGLKEGDTPRILIAQADEKAAWGLSHYIVQQFGNLKKAPKPVDYDGNGYVSLLEAYKLHEQLVKKCNRSYVIIDKDNLANKIYIGDKTDIDTLSLFHNIERFEEYTIPEVVIVDRNTNK